MKTDTNTDLFAQLFPLEPTKSQRRVVSILDAAIESYATLGIDNTTYDSIAKICGVTRPLIQHYFASKREIFELVVKYVRANFQRVAIEALRNKRTPQEQLEAYVRSTFAWVRDYPKHVLVWQLFYYYCGIDPKLRALNTELVSMGHARIAALLERGAAEGVFAPGKRSSAAKAIQVQVTGALLAVATEALPTKLPRFIETTVETCLLIARSR